MAIARLESQQDLDLVIRAVENNSCEVSRIQAINEGWDSYVIMVEYKSLSRVDALSMMVGLDLLRVSSFGHQYTII